MSIVSSRQSLPMERSAGGVAVGLSVLGRRMTRISGVQAALGRRRQLLQAGRPFVDLSVGNPALLPEVADLWREAAVMVSSDSSFDQLVGSYGDLLGYRPLREAVAEMFSREYGWSVEAKNVLVTSGSQMSSFLAINVVAGAGRTHERRVVVQPVVPEYPGYDQVLLSEGCLVSRKPGVVLDGPHQFTYHLESRPASALDNVVGFVLSRPSNPSGNVLTRKEMTSIVEHSSRSSAVAIGDAAYGSPVPGIAWSYSQPIWGENVLHLVSLSKAGLPGERIGLMIGHEDILAAVAAFQANVTFHPSSIGQSMAASVIANGTLARLCENVIKAHYRERYHLVGEILSVLLPDVPWYLHRSQGGIFAWLWFPKLPITSEALSGILADDGVLVVPGEPFFQGLPEPWDHAHQCVRLSLTAEPVDLEAGILTLGRLLDRLHG